MRPDKPIVFQPEPLPGLVSAKKLWGSSFTGTRWRCEVYSLSPNDSVRTPQEVSKLLDRFVESLGFPKANRRWDEFDAPAAKEHIERNLHELLTKGASMPVLKKETDLVREFFSPFPEGGRFFRSATPLRGSFFEIGVIALGPSRIGILFIDEED